MKSLVVGAMFLQSINAQFVPATGADTLAPFAAAQPAPVLTPDTNNFVVPPQPPALAAAPALQAAPVEEAAIAPEEDSASSGNFETFADAGAPVGADPIVEPGLTPIAAPVGASPVAEPVDGSPVVAPVGGSPAVAPVVAPVGASPVAEPVGGSPVVAPVGGSPVVAPVGGSPVAAPVGGSPVAAPVGGSPVAAPVGGSPVAAPVDASPISVPIGATPIVAPIGSAPIIAPIGSTPVASLVDASPIPAPIDATPIVAPIGSAPIIAPIGSTPIVDVSATPIISPISSPTLDAGSIIVTPTVLPGGSAALPIGVDPYSIYDPNSPYYDPYAQPPGWEGDDNGIYDGEDDDTYHGGKAPVKNPGYGYDDEEECPAWCHADADYDYSPYQPTPTPAKPYKEEPYNAPTKDYEAEPKYYPGSGSNKYPQLKKVRSILRAVRRQVFNWPQPTYLDDDDDTGAYEGEDGSIPDWLYDISGAPKRPTYTPKPKPECPKSCYKHTTTTKDYATKPDRPTYTYTRKGGYKTTAEPYYPEPTKGGYKTTDEPYYPEPTKDVYYGSVGTGSPYKPEYTSNAWYPQGNSTAVYWPTGPTGYYNKPTSAPYEPIYEPTAAPYEPTAAPYEPTTLATYYQQPQPYPEQTGGSWSDPGSPAGDYTGDTLDTLCPNICNPFNPAENFCDITTGCATTGGSKYYCACRAGFRADNYNAKDFSKQFKVAGQPYVYLAVSTSCNTPCSDQTCSEVLERSQCK